MGGGGEKKGGGWGERERALPFSGAGSCLLSRFLTSSSPAPVATWCGVQTANSIIKSSLGAGSSVGKGRKRKIGERSGTPRSNV